MKNCAGYELLDNDVLALLWLLLLTLMLVLTLLLLLCLSMT